MIEMVREPYLYERDYNVLLAMFLAAAHLSGCAVPHMPDRFEARKTISILYSSVQAFQLEYGSTLQHQFEDIDIEIIEYKPSMGEGIWNGHAGIPHSTPACT